MHENRHQQAFVVVVSDFYSLGVRLLLAAARHSFNKEAASTHDHRMESFGEYGSSSQL